MAVKNRVHSPTLILTDPEQRAQSLPKVTFRLLPLMVAPSGALQFAQKIAGHASERYIWRYVSPSETDMDQAAESLWD